MRDPLLQQQPHRGQVGDVIHLGAQPARDVGMPVDAQRLGGVLDQPRPQDQPVGDQRFHETHRRPPGRACSELTGRGADRSGRRSAGASGRRRPPSVITVRCGPDASSARQRPDRVHHLNATQAPTATRATARRWGRLFPAAGPRGDPLGDLRVRCRCAHGQPARRTPPVRGRSSCVVGGPGLVTETDAHHVMRHERPFRAAGVRC